MSGSLTTAALLIGGGFVALKFAVPAAAQSITAIRGVATPNGPAVGPPAAPGPNSTGPSSFNFNANDTQAWYHENGGTIDGHIGFGHVGAGVQVAVVVEARDAGIYGTGVASSNYSKIYETSVNVGTDSDWTGYGVDFSGIGGLSVGLFHLVQMRYSITGYTDYQSFANKGF